MTLPSTSAADTASTAALGSKLASGREGASGCVEVKSEDVSEDVNEDVNEDPVAPAMSPVPAPTPVPSSSDALVAAGRPVPPAVERAPLSRVAQLNSRVEKDALDGEARLALIADAVQKGDLERTREVYEEFLKVFPDASNQWIAYVDLELSHSFFPRVEALFARCLRPSPSVSLWKFYLDYIRRVNPVDPSLGDRPRMREASLARVSSLLSRTLEWIDWREKCGSSTLDS